MEVATTNNHHHHNHHAHHQQQLTVVGGNGNSNSNNNSNNNNSIIKNGGARSPFQREVREWQRIDPDTGALLSGRLEADRWINGPLNSYGKISDSQNISQPNGTQQTQRKQFEVLQARTANGAMQVIRTHTVQTTSSRWSSTTNTSSSSTSSPATILDKNNYNNSFNTYHNNNNYNNKHCHIANTSYSPYRTPPTTTITTTTLPTNSNAIDICEISDDDFMQNTEHRLNGDNIVVTLIDEDDNDNKNDMFNGNSNNNTHTLNHNHRSDSLRKLGHNLLLDTAPSLKLSNLMKSSSSISSQSSNNSYTNTTTSAATMNTHRNAAKISLHAIVGNNNNNTNNTAKSATSSSSTTASSSSSLLTNTATLEDRITAATSSSSSSTATTTPWHKRLSEQPDLYGNSNNKLNQSRVGVNSSIVDGSGVGGVTETAGGGGGGGADDIAAVRQTPTQVNRQTRRDLESFRHYNEHAKSSTYNDDDNDDDDDDNDEDLRLTARHQRRQQVPQYAPIPLQRSRSISTDDLSNDWDRNDLGQHTDDEPGEWRRVSKLRRSFQSTSTSSSSNTTATPRRPLDLPSNSVSVSRIRAELENGRRLNTAMRNNHVDLAALDTMLNATAAATAAAAEKHALAKRNTFLTAESLKEIRGKLKKLSDESLYKEDFLAYQAPRETPDFEQEHIEVQLVKPLPFVETRSAFQPVVRTGTGTQRTLYPYASSTNSSSQANPGQTTHKTHSLESRQKYRDTNSSEWHLRRKSYGFEKMSPPEDRSIFRVDASTDSGLGRSGDQLGNWSPTETSSNARGTIIHFGEPQQQQQQQLTTSYRRPSKSPETGELNKRHSIAVAEESQYMRKTSQVHLNGINGEPIADASTTSRHTQQKRVEFCKTEVHFAAESGRVNIVETDGKPPPTNNFRRRRRSSAGPLQSLVKSATTVSTPSAGLPMTHFGDDHRSKSNTASTTVAYKATLMEPPELVTQPTHVTVTTPKPLESSYSLTETTSTSTSRNSYTSTSGIDTTTDNETDEISAIRGILKNKPIKPKPYHLGENINSADALWGVQLKTAPTDRQQAALDEAPASPKSVAERVRIVEKRQVEPESNGYSTKINLSLGEKDWHETGFSATEEQSRRPSAQALLLQDLREHQRILDEGLKSTSLIIRTMRSASAFDEAMRRLSIASVESALIQPTIVVPTPMLRSNSYQDSMASSRRDSNATITSADLYGSTLYDSLPRRYSHESFVPLAPPRLKLLGNTEIPVSQQLTQLRRMYDAAQDELDSADEEVKSYFTHYENSDSGGGTQDTSSSLEDVRSATEYSSSWSRLKAKRTVWQIELDEQHQQQQQQQQQVHMLKRADLPKSNVMSIALHSPKAEPQLEQQKKPVLRVSQLVPVAKPRTTLSSVPTAMQPEVHTALCVKQSNDSTSDSDSLKIVKEARGARKLREHELSYFGVQVSKAESMSSKSSTHQTNRRSLPSRKLSAEERHNQTTTKWQLLNDRPDLLRHSPIEPQASSIKAAERQSLKQKTVASDEDFDEHFYENIAHDLQPSFRVKSPTPNAYDRKTDVQRDVQILSEMTRNADQTLKALSDEAALKDQRRRSSLQRRNSKPLETIDEKSFTSDKTSDSLSIARGTYASEARRNSRQSTPSPTHARSSSQSSLECCPRARSRSLSSEREYENVKTRRSVQHTKPTTTSTRRSSSRDSATQCSSGEEQLKREERLRTRTPKRINSSNSSSTQAREKQRLSSGTHAVEKRRDEGSALKQRSSSMRERTERERKSTHERTHSSSRRHQHKHDDGDRSSRLQHGSGSGSNGQRVRSHSSDRHERHPGTRLVRAARVHEHESNGQRASAQRLERHDKEKDKHSRSRGHSNRSSHSEREREHKPTTTRTTTTNTAQQAHRKSSSSKSSTTTTTANKHAHKTQSAQQALNEHELTHGKNTQLLNGHHGHQHGQHNQHIQHSLATTTITAKQRERHGKDRK